MRGIYTTGILDAFIENDINFDGVIGVSGWDEKSGEGEGISLFSIIDIYNHKNILQDKCLYEHSS